MPVLALDHVNIAAPMEILLRCRDFYVDVLGFTEGPRPQFRSRGFWLYAGGRAVMHLSDTDRETDGTSALDHFALACEDLDGMMARLRERGIAFHLDPAREGKNAQLFLEDPAGVQIELNFRD